MKRIIFIFLSMALLLSNAVYAEEQEVNQVSLHPDSQELAATTSDDDGTERPKKKKTAKKTKKNKKAKKTKKAKNK